MADLIITEEPNISVSWRIKMKSFENACFFVYNEIEFNHTQK